MAEEEKSHQDFKEEGAGADESSATPAEHAPDDRPAEKATHPIAAYTK